MLSREWFTAAALAALALPGLPRSKPAVIALAKRAGWQHPEAEGRLWRRRRGRGGGVEYHCSVLPAAAQAVLARMSAAGAAEGDGRAALLALLAAVDLEALVAAHAIARQVHRERFGREPDAARLRRWTAALYGVLCETPADGEGAAGC
ncbi:hypothetical protein GCM10010964_18360 [Caldovatus sediminis]|uniref:HTH Mu-type domain-containing protein n=1 Tax=Caldovatus sediminis TaxID=2041189 RepID=A0A8J3EAU1_9PROT|nr:DNA-binding protein [Caldovatus sediminis]GGG30782.1 hypothetical protein GCM10010964_18360 [Caldovatus sediminis]